MPPFGLLNIRKPSGLTSRDVVDSVGRSLGRVKLGHAGTLDPLAEGVLVLAVGKATRLVPYLQAMPKTYRGTFLLGRQSDTEDVEGSVELLVDPPQPTETQLQSILPRFVGQIDQRPPAYSAIKVKGRRAYKLAREGQAVELAARPVMVYELALVQYDYPQMILDVTCGGGTYIRSLGRDIAEALGTAAVMSALVRTAIGALHVDTAVSLAEAEADPLRHLLPASMAVASLPQVTVDSDEIQNISHGRELPDRFDSAPGNEIAGCDAEGRLIAILTRHASGLRPSKCFI